MKTTFRWSIVFFTFTLYFITTSCSKEEIITLPLITTTEVTGLNDSVAISGGILTSLGNTSQITIGVCWNTSANPTVANSKTKQSGGLGDFTCILTNLLPNNKYYIKAYASNSAGTSYGNEVTYTTKSNSTLHYLGESFGGGIIFNVYRGSDGKEHGLIVSLTQSSGPYQNPTNLTNATRTWDGAYNTNLLFDSPIKTWVQTLGSGW